MRTNRWIDGRGERRRGDGGRPSRRRRAAIGLCGLAGALATAGCGSSGHAAAPPTAAPTTTASTAPATTTPSTSGSSPSSAPASSSSSVAPSSTTTSLVGLALSGAGTTLTAPTAPTTKPYSADCQTLIDPGFYGECSVAAGPSGTVAGVVEQRRETYQPGQPIVTGQERDLVYRKVGDSWSLRLRRIPVADGEALTQVSTSDIMRDGDPKVVFVEPAPNSSFGDELDVVDGTGTVTLFRQLHGGFARVLPAGGLETYVPDAAGGYAAAVIRYDDGAWRIASVTHVSESQAQAEGSGAFTDPEGTPAVG